MKKVFDEDFYTDDFDKEVIDYLVDAGWIVQDNDGDSANLSDKYLRFGIINCYFWTTNNSGKFNLGTLLTKQQFKEKIGMASKQGYKLADGTYSSEYTVGDKFETVDGEIFQKGSIVVYTNDDNSDCPWFTNEHGQEYSCMWDRLKAYKQFTKSDLLDGMRVVYRNGEERVVFYGKLYEQYGSYLSVVAELSEFESDLTHEEESDLDIMKVTDRDGTILFTRTESSVKSAAQIELDKLQEQMITLHEQIASLQQRADKLQQTL